MNMEILLSFEQVYAGYGKTNVLNGLTFDVIRGEIFGVIGPNGCGKTTMLNVLSGLIRLSSGTIRMDGKPIHTLSVDARCRSGIGRTFQIPRPFERMRVYENVMASAVFGGGMKEKDAKQPTEDVLKKTGLYDKRNLMAGALTLLDRKRLEVARIIVSRPKLLLFDEVAAGLTSVEVAQMIELAEYLKETGFTIIWIEHILETMMCCADRLMCMADGKCAILGSPDQVIHSNIVQELYLGIGGEDEHAED